MAEKKFYKLPGLAYGYGELAPHMSEEQLKIHHQKHHQAYVDGANAILEKLDKAHKEGAELDLKSVLKELSWNIGGHLLHSIFWENLAPAERGGGGEPKGEVAAAVKNDFGSFENFKKEFTKTALSVEGSGWSALTYCRQTNRLLLMQIEKHNTNVYPMFRILMVADVFEHAYYIDYKNLRAKFVEAFWNIVNWGDVNDRFRQALK